MKNLIALVSLLSLTLPTAPVKASSLADINYAHPHVVLKANVLDSGEALVEEYPTQFQGEVSLVKLQSFNLGDQLEPACQKVKDRIQLLRSKLIGESIKKSWREAMLLPNIVNLRVDLQPWIQPSALEVKIRQTLPKPMSFVAVWNPLRLDAFQLQFHVQEDASSLQMESLTEIQKRMLAFQSPGLLVDGYSPIIISSVPLVCDIAQGKIQLAYRLQGHYGDPKSHASFLPETSPLNLPYEASVPLQWIGP